MRFTRDVTIVASSLGKKKGCSDVSDKILCYSHLVTQHCVDHASSALLGLLYEAKTSCSGTARSFTSALLPFQLRVYSSWTGSLCPVPEGQIGELARRGEARIHSRQCRPNPVHVGVRATWHPQDAAKHVGRWMAWSSSTSTFITDTCGSLKSGCGSGFKRCHSSAVCSSCFHRDLALKLFHTMSECPSVLAVQYGQGVAEP